MKKKRWCEPKLESLCVNITADDCQSGGEPVSLEYCTFGANGQWQYTGFNMTGYEKNEMV